MLICGASGTGKTNTLIHMLLEPLIYYDKIYLYAKIKKNPEQDKYSLLSERLNKIANKHEIPLEDILFSSNDEIIPYAEMDNSDQKVIIFDVYVCDKNQNDIINYFIQGRQNNCFHNHIIKLWTKDIRLNCSHYIIFEAPSKREAMSICNEQSIPLDKYKAAFNKRYNFIYLDKINKQINRNFYGNI